jgi:Methyltransferase domain
MLQPDRHVGVDNSERGDSTYFKRWITARGLGDKVATHWGVDQSDQEELRDIAQQEFDGPLDLVIDDASHFYAPTKASFEALFPLLRKGGLYVIEDWGWEHTQEFVDPEHPWAKDKKGLSSLVVELVEATGTMDKGLVESLTVTAGFTAVRRGWASIDEREFELEHYILRRQKV